MKKKGNARARKTPTDMVLHRTFHCTKTVQVSSATQGLAHKLRALSVPITDIRKDNSLLSLGLEDQGHGVWRFNTELKPTRYLRPTQAKKRKKDDGVVQKQMVRRGRVGVSEALPISGLSENNIMVEEGNKRTKSRTAVKTSPVVVDLLSSDEDILDAYIPPVRVDKRKRGSNSLKRGESGERKAAQHTKDKNLDVRVKNDGNSSPEVKTRSSRNQPLNSSPKESELSPRRKKQMPEVSRAGREVRNAALPSGSNDVKKSPKIVIKRLTSPRKRYVSSLKSPVEVVDSNVIGRRSRSRSVQRESDKNDSDSAEKCGPKSVSPLVHLTRKRKGETAATTSSSDSAKPLKGSRLRGKKSEVSGSRSSSTSLPDSSKQRKRLGLLEKKELPKKPLKKSEPKNSPSENDGTKPLPKPKSARKHQNKVQMQWCSICGVELDSLDNKLEHEFNHLEPRQLFVSLHRCYLNQVSIKLPIYVSSEDLASIPEPEEDQSSPISSDNGEHPLLPIDDVLNHDEENAYESYSSSDDELGFSERKCPLGEDGCQDPPSGDSNGEVACEMMVTTPVASPERCTPIKSPRSVGSKERSKRKSQVKMRLWEGPPVTRSGRVVKVTKKTKECMEQLACARVLFSGKESEGDTTRSLESEESATDDTTGGKKNEDEEKLIPLVEEYVEVVVMKGDLKDIVESGSRDSESTSDKLPKGDASSGIDLTPREESKGQDPNLEANDSLDTGGLAVADVGAIEKECPLEKAEDVTEEPAGGSVSSEALERADAPLAENIEALEPSPENNDNLESAVLESIGSSTIETEVPLGETPEVDGQQSEGDEGSVLTENVVSEDLKEDNLMTKDDVAENEPDLIPDINENIGHDLLSGETSEKVIDSVADEVLAEVQDGDVPEKVDEGALSLGDIGKENVVTESVEESKVSERDILEPVPERDAAEQMTEDGMGIVGILEDAIDESSKELMLVDEANDVLVGGALAENVEMQESSETEFISVPNDIDICKFNMPEDQGLEDISDDEWADMSDKEMEQSPQFVNGNLGDVEMDEGANSGVDNLGQEGAMDLEEADKDAGLPDPMCTGEVGDALEEEMKDLDSADDAMMADNVVDEMVGVLSSKDNMSIVEGVESAAEVDMTEAVEDAEDGCIAEAIDVIQGEDPVESLAELAEKVNSDGETTVEVGSVGMDLLREENTDSKIEGSVVCGEENGLPSNSVVEDVAVEVAAVAKIPVNGINLSEVMGSSEDQCNDLNGGESVAAVAKISDSILLGGCKGDSLDILNESRVEVKSDVCVSGRNVDSNKVYAGSGNELTGSH